MNDGALAQEGDVESVTPGHTVDAQEAASSWPLLTAIEVRVLGCLMEKAATTPEYYPLTLNALTNACNQKSNRDPVMAVSESDVQQALDVLRYEHRLAALVHTAGSRTEKFKHTISQVIEGIHPAQAAVLCELFLRGPETVGELRTRASRIHAFNQLQEVETVLMELANHARGPLVVKLPREPGRRESRWMHVWAGMPSVTADIEAASPPAAAAEPAWREEVEKLRAELDALKAEFSAFRAQFEG